MKLTLVLLVVVISLMIAMPASATVITLGGDADYANLVTCKIDRSAPDGGDSIGDYLTQNNNNQYEFMVRFLGLSVIPAGSTINSATLTVVASDWNGLDPVTTYSLLKPIGPGTGNPVPAGGTSYNSNIQGTSTWSVPGLGAGLDYAAAVDPAVTYTGSWQSLAHNVTASLQQQVNSGNVYGWFVHGSSASQYVVWRHSLLTGGVNPTLVVDYTAVPEPGSLLALAGGLGCLMGFARRRRS